MNFSVLFCRWWQISIMLSCSFPFIPEMRMERTAEIKTALFIFKHMVINHHFLLLNIFSNIYTFFDYMEINLQTRKEELMARRRALGPRERFGRAILGWFNQRDFPSQKYFSFPFFKQLQFGFFSRKIVSFLSYVFCLSGRFFVSDEKNCQRWVNL